MEVFAILVLLVVIALLLPAKYDPAIQLKEWNERQRKSGDGGV